MLIIQGNHINSEGPHLPRDALGGKGPPATFTLVELQGNLRDIYELLLI